MPLGDLDGSQRRRARGHHAVLDLMQTMPSFVLPAAARAVLRHRRLPRRSCSRSSTRCRRWSGSPRTASGACSPTTIEADRLAGPTRCQLLRKVQLPMAQAHHHRRPQPDDHGRAVDGDHRGAGRRARPRRAGASALQSLRRRRRVRRRPVHRGHGDHARPRRPPRPSERSETGQPAAAMPTREAARDHPRRRRASVAVVAIYLSRTTPGCAEFPECEPGPEVHQRPELTVRQRLHRLVHRCSSTGSPRRSRTTSPTGSSTR